MKNKQGFFSKMIAARQRQAQLYVNYSLSQMDDKRLQELGHDPFEVRQRPKSYISLI
jgi:hypothetical protein